jgi:hypothetical protein
MDAPTVAVVIGGETRVRGRHVSAWVPADFAVAALEKLMATVGQESLEDVRMITPTLEDVYLEASGHPMREAER